MKTAAYILLFSAASLSAAEMPSHLLSTWLDHQSRISTWAATCLQTRVFSSMNQPLVSTGRVSFCAPNRFRWELGQPARTIAIRGEKDLLILYPKLGRAERYSLEGNKLAPWQQALALIEAGFPRTAEQLKTQYQLISEAITNGTCEVALEPRSPGTRNLLVEVRIVFATNTLSLLSTEMVFANGSLLRNEFTNQVVDETLPPETFNTTIPEGFRQAQPPSK